MIKSLLRSNDEKGEKLVGLFLDEYFYKNKTTNFSRINDFENQIKGIDTIFDFLGENYMCDEKAAIQYINKRLNTFSLELSFINKGGKENVGWLLAPDKVNNSFLFCWIDKATNDKLDNYTDILQMEIALIKKSSIINKLISLGWTLDKLQNKCDRIRQNETEYLGNIYEHGLKFHKSFQLVEKPINVLLPRKTLIELADYSEVINKKE